MMYFRPAPNVLDAKFLLYSIYGSVIRAYIESTSNGSTVGHLRLGQVTTLPLLWCPVLEQEHIVAHIDKISVPIDDSITHIEREIALLQEYRTRLTTDVVTGKLDVREAARRLPEAEDDDAVPETEPTAAEDDLEIMEAS